MYINLNQVLSPGLIHANKKAGPLRVRLFLGFRVINSLWWRAELRGILLSLAPTPYTNRYTAYRESSYANRYIRFLLSRKVNPSSRATVSRGFTLPAQLPTTLLTLRLVPNTSYLILESKTQQSCSTTLVPGRFFLRSFFFSVACLYF